MTRAWPAESANMTSVPFSIRVRFYELDPYGHVNHATYLQYFEAARVAWLADIGHGLDRLLDEGVQLMVTAVAVRFHAAALLNDRLVIDTAVVDARRVQTQWAQRIRRGDEPIASQRVNLAAVSASGRPTRIPESLAGAMAEATIGAEWDAVALPDLALR